MEPTNTPATNSHSTSALAPLAVTERYFDALAVGDLATVGSLLADEIAWHQPGTNRFTGVHNGPQAVGALVTAMMKRSQGTFRISVTGPALANGELVAVPVRFTGSRPADGDGAQVIMDMAGVDLLTVRDGKVVRVDLFSADGEAEDRFWG